MIYKRQVITKYSYMSNIVANFMQGRNHYIQAKQNIATGRHYIELPKGQRKALRRERELSSMSSNYPITPNNIYDEVLYPSNYLQNKRMNRHEDSKSDISILKRQAQLQDNYVVPYDTQSMKDRLQNSNRFKNIQANPKYSIGTLNPLENNSQFLLTNRRTTVQKPEVREIGNDYTRMSNDYNNIGHNFTPGSMPENLIEDMQQPAHIVPLYNDNVSYQGNFLRSKLGFSPTRVRKLKSGETPTQFLDIPSSKTIY